VAIKTTTTLNIMPSVPVSKIRGAVILKKKLKIKAMK
jgi:hypothetical protein